MRGCFPESRFVRAVSVLAGGTAISQLIAIAVLPLLTRIYSPEDFSVLAVYTSVLALITAVACLRFEIAIPIPKKESQAKELLILSLLSVLFITLVALLVVFLFPSQIHAVTQDRLRGYLWLIPLGGMLSGLYAAFQYWAIRDKSFVLISKTKMTQAISGAGAQVGFGYIGLSPLGLLLGQLLSVGAGVWGLARSYYKNKKNHFVKLTPSGLRTTFQEYERFPKYSTFEALFNSAAIQVPVLLVAAYAIGPEVGFLMLAMRLLSAPMSLIGGAVAQVYLSEAPVYHQSGELKKFTCKTIWSLTKVGVPTLFLAGVSAPFLVPLVFGDGWDRAGTLIAWMAPWFFMQFISSPVSMSLHITGNARAALMLQVFGLIFRAGLVLWAGLSFKEYMLEVYALTGLVFYAVYIWVIMWIIDKSVPEA